MSQEEKAREPSALLAVGVISSTHGIAGELKVKSYSGEHAHLLGLREALLRKGDVERTVTFEWVRRQDPGVIVKVEGLETPEKARALVGWEIWVARSSADPLGSNEYYAADLCRCLIFVRDTLRDHPMLVNPVLRDVARRIARGFDRDIVPDPAFRVIQVALTKAKPVLRPEVDMTAASLSLLGLIVIYLMEECYLPSAEIAKGDQLFAAALRPMILWKPDA